MTERREATDRVQSTARRRLVGGSFSLPVALTLYSGSTSAATSITCVVKQVHSPKYPDPVTVTGGDTWVRVRTWVVAGIDEGKISTWIKADDVRAISLPPGGSWYLQSNQWQLVSKGLKSKYSETLLGSIVDGTPTEQGKQSETQTGPWVALRFDANGNIVGAVILGVTNPAGSSALGGSCLTSFRLMAP